MSSERYLEGLVLKVGPLGETDRLISLLSDEEGLTRLAVPGARRPRSKMAAALPLTFLKLQVVGRTGLNRVRQLKVLKSFGKLGLKLETLSAAQALTDLSMMLVAHNDPVPGLLSTLLMHLERLEDLSRISPFEQESTLASSVQSCLHLLALGGYGIPIQSCCKTGKPLDPPLGDWAWRCSFLPEEGFVIGALPGAAVQLNPSELALLQILPRPNLPFRKNGELLGPKKVWLRLLSVIQYWIKAHLNRNIKALSMLQTSVIEEDEKN